MMCPHRRKNCEIAAHEMNKTSLRDASLLELEECRSKFSSEEIFHRARHVVTEIDRTNKAAELLKKADLVQFGKLMVESHNSLRSVTVMEHNSYGCFHNILFQR